VLVALALVALLTALAAVLAVLAAEFAAELAALAAAFAELAAALAALAAVFETVLAALAAALAALAAALAALAAVFAFVFALLAAGSPQANPKAATAKRVERAKVFFILKLISCLLKDNIIICVHDCFYQPFPTSKFGNIGQYKYLIIHSQTKKREKTIFHKVFSKKSAFLEFETK
jgi:ABC-type transporter Mla subunit MlaD